jgi:HAD superfamily hydrolase (TIGR01509 family)
MKRFAAAIFDCDGTLVDSEELGNGVLAEMVSEQGLPLSIAAATAEFRGMKLAECLRFVEQRLGRRLHEGFVPEFRARSAAAFRAHLRPIAGAAELLNALSIPFCVASSGPREKIELSLSLTGLLPLFGERIFSAYEVQSWKPAPDLFLHAAQSLGAAAADCAVVEDSWPGISAGLAAGMTVFAYQPAERDPRIPGDVQVVTRLLDLLPLLDAASTGSARSLDRSA